MRVLMVCLGNICRSPMAEGILRHKAQERGLDIEIDSCGTSGWHAGEQPDRRAQVTLKSKSMDISDLRARQFSPQDFMAFDLIYTMDSSNQEDVIALASSSEQEEKVSMILDEITPGGGMPVPDPYYGGDQGFEEVFSLLDNACDIICDKIERG